MRSSWLLAALLSACVPSRSAVFGPVRREVQDRIGVGIAWGEHCRVRGAIEELLAKPLDLDAAVRIALARNQHLQAKFDELGIAASEIAAATVFSPVEVDADYKRAVSGSGDEVEVTAVQDVLGLLQVRQRRAIASAELRGARARAVAATVELAAEVEGAFWDVVATAQEHQLAQTLFDTAAASADLIERQHAAGNASDLRLAREQEQRERARVELTHSGQLLVERRAHLTALLGIGKASSAWSTAGRLPEAPATPPDLHDLEKAALASNLDLSALRADAEAARARGRYATVRAFVPELGVGVAAARRDGEGWGVGPVIRFGVPLFDQQQAPRARARAEEQRAHSELAATTIDLRARAESVRSRVMAAFAEARQLADVVVPLRRRVLDETALQYNAMNASTFELLTARREMADIERQYIETLRAYWTAVAEAKALQRGGSAMKEVPQ